ncbi:hypothetical protein STANM309S_05250 [Streptomyces tanashiensis]
MTAPTLVAVGHGSRDPRARATLARLLDRVRELRPDSTSASPTSN